MTNSREDNETPWTIPLYILTSAMSSGWLILLWIVVNRSNQQPWIPSRLGLFQFAIFLGIENIFLLPILFRFLVICSHFDWPLSLSGVFLSLPKICSKVPRAFFLCFAVYLFIETTFVILESYIMILLLDPVSISFASTLRHQYWLFGLFFLSE